jgi:putative NADH-flavin reductase
MKLFVIGATGHTGAQIIDIALARSHNVTAFVRSPQKINRHDLRLRVVQGDPHSLEQLAKELPGHDAVLSAIGIRPPQAFRPHSLVDECAASTVAAMAKTGVDRLVLVSAAVLFPEKGLVFAFFRRLLKYIVRDLKAAEETVRGTSLEWTIARPPRLTNGSAADYRAARDALPGKGFSMSFRGVAAFMLDAVEQRSYLRQIVGLAS